MFWTGRVGKIKRNRVAVKNLSFREAKLRASRRSKYKANTIEDCVKTFLAVVEDALLDGEVVHLKPLGSFRIRGVAGDPSRKRVYMTPSPKFTRFLRSIPSELPPGYDSWLENL